MSENLVEVSQNPDKVQRQFCSSV